MGLGRCIINELFTITLKLRHYRRNKLRGPVVDSPGNCGACPPSRLVSPGDVTWATRDERGSEPSCRTTPERPEGSRDERDHPDGPVWKFGRLVVNKYPEPLSLVWDRRFFPDHSVDVTGPPSPSPPPGPPPRLRYIVSIQALRPKVVSSSRCASFDSSQIIVQIKVLTPVPECTTPRSRRRIPIQPPHPFQWSNVSIDILLPTGCPRHWKSPVYVCEVSSFPAPLL